MFDPNDYYVASGSTDITNSWTATVTKFDSSSFYNWEQDNLPLYDLEERTDYLWEKAGFPTSSIPGVSLVVSSTGADGINVFSTLADAVDALPDTIRFPYLIEVAASGDLGKLELNNIKMDGPTAGLEIVNRAFGKALSLSSASIGDYTSIHSMLDTSTILTVSSLDLSSTLSGTSAVSVSALVTNDWETCSVAMFMHPEWGVNGERTNKLTVSINNSGFLTASAGIFDLTESLGTDSTTDISVVHGTDGSVIDRGAVTAGNKATGVVYGNTLTELKITGCDKGVFVRGFVVDGQDTHTKEEGIIIDNSKVVLENCAAIRCKVAGAKITNSEVTLARGFIAYRNYEISAGLVERIDNKVAGMHLINSVLTLSSTTTQARGIPIDSPFVFAYNEIGLLADNSTIQGGTIRGYDSDGTVITGGAADNNKNMLYVSVFMNTADGVVLNSSAWKSDARPSIFYNNRGFTLHSSKMEVAEMSIGHNQNYGINLISSELVYNKNLVTEGTIGDSLNSHSWFELNGQHILSTNSVVYMPEGNNLPTKTGRLMLDRNHKVITNGTILTTAPAIELNRSVASLAGLRLLTEDAITDNNLFSGNIHYGSAAKLEGSELELKGFATYATLIAGSKDLGQQVNNAGIYANNGSKVSLQGPTSIVQFGVDVLTNNGSVLSIKPHSKNGAFDSSGWDLSSTDNHTKVQLHSSRACLIADNNSILEFVDSGDYHDKWTDTDIVSSLIVNGTAIADYNATDSLEISALNYGGYVQFYPNPQDTDSTFMGVTLTTYDVSANSTLSSNAFTDLVDYSSATSEDEHKVYSYGGVCVRALRGSNVKVKNVHFPTGWHNASGAVYDISSNNCNMLYIWNIANDSTLDVSYASVSGTFPSKVGYHGPSAVYVSGAGIEASGAPSGTPDTSSISVLDSFGMGGTFGKATWENQGAFRLFVSPTGPAKFIGYVSGTTVLEGAPYQQVAQGYNPSGNTSSIAGLEDLYSSLAASGFHYASALTVPSNDRIRLDDSGASLFANAKHAAQGKSGTNKLVTIYKAIIQPTGEGYDSDKVAGHGIGFLSANTFDLSRQN
jgi:hypothetical protein